MKRTHSNLSCHYVVWALKLNECQIRKWIYKNMPITRTIINFLSQLQWLWIMIVTLNGTLRTPLFLNVRCFPNAHLGQKFYESLMRRFFKAMVTTLGYITKLLKLITISEYPWLTYLWLLFLYDLSKPYLEKFRHTTLESWEYYT